MRLRHRINWLPLLCLLLGLQTTQSVHAYGRYDRHGIYDGFSDNHHITIGVNADYYFGDLETKALFATSQLGGSFTIGYRYQFNQFAAVGLHATGGMLRGNDQYRYHFQSLFETTELLYTCFPIPNAGLYISTGAGMTVSSVDFAGTSSTGINYAHKETSISPTIPVHLGYTFNVGEHSRLGVQFCYTTTLTDTPNHSLDGYPFLDNGTIIGEKDSQNIDSYFSFGVNYEVYF